jgi:hypothetical protein
MRLWLLLVCKREAGPHILEMLAVPPKRLYLSNKLPVSHIPAICSLKIYQCEILKPHTGVLLCCLVYLTTLSRLYMLLLDGEWWKHRGMKWPWSILWLNVS